MTGSRKTLRQTKITDISLRNPIQTLVVVSAYLELSTRRSVEVIHVMNRGKRYSETGGGEILKL